MVTGVYLPELNGAVLQCSEFIKWAAKDVDFRVLAGSNGRAWTKEVTENGVPITRIGAEDSSLTHKYLYLLLFYLNFIWLSATVEIVHIHGFSTRNALIILLARLLRKKVVLKMTSFGLDDPMSVKRRSRTPWFLYRLTNSYIAIGPAFMHSSEQAGIDLERCHLIPNAVDTKKFCPTSRSDRANLRSKLGLSNEEAIILFVGHLSTEKRLNILYEAWRDLLEEGYDSRLIVIGKTSGFEVNSALISSILADGGKRRLLEKLTLIESTNFVAEYMKAADIFVHPSIREGMPNVVLEAMACSLPCIVTEISGVTDFLINHGRTGFLIKQDDFVGLKKTLKALMVDQSLGDQIGKSARDFVLSRHEWRVISTAIQNAYGIASKS